MGRLNFVRRHENMTDEWLAKKLGIELDFVKAIRRHNGLVKGVKWTTEDDDWIENHYPGASERDVMRRFPNRSKSAVYQRSMRLKRGEI